jgi:hypothetical protein
MVHTFPAGKEMRLAGEVREMDVAMSNALALLRWHGFRSLEEGDTTEKLCGRRLEWRWVCW